MILAEAREFDIILVRTLDFQGQRHYLVHYGMQTEVFTDCPEAILAFRNCLSHAIASEGDK